jgi:hypothetical protein
MGVALIASDFTARVVYFFTADDSLRTTLTDFSHVNGFELPSPFLIAQALILLWLLYVLSAKGVSGEAINVENGSDDYSVDTVDSES